MRTKAVKPDSMDVVLRLLTPQNANVCRVCLAHGLRVGDALQLRTEQLRQKKITLREQKTGKRRVIVLSEQLRQQLFRYAGRVFVFPSRCDEYRTRTRQAVWKDLRRAARALRLSGGLGTHSMRKTYAVRKYAACGDIRTVQRLLNHGDSAVTALYIMADFVHERGEPSEQRRN